MAERRRQALILARGSNPSLRKHRPLLARIEQTLPQGTQLQIWSDLEIFDRDNRIYEIDAVALGHYGLYVLEVTQRAEHALSEVRKKSDLLDEFFAQELGPGKLSVEPLILSSEEDVAMMTRSATPQGSVTAGELLRVLQSGELSGRLSSPARVPLDPATMAAITETMGGLRRMVRPGRGNFQQELALLQRDLVVDLTRVANGRGSMTSPAAAMGDAARHRIEEAASAWVIACVFLRVLEERTYIASRLSAEGADLVHLLSAIAHYPACEAILGQRNRALSELAPTEQGMAALRSFFGGSDGQNRDHYLDDRLWGDLYQSLSEPLRQVNARIQTPSFVEDFLLDRVLEPACTAVGASSVSVIDPACGSGALLVGAFQRLLERTLAMDPVTSRVGCALAALGQVHGVDISPTATMITQIRLLLTYLGTTGSASLHDVVKLPLQVTTADALLSPDEVLARRYTVVVCEPPFVVAKDQALRDAYRERYRSASGRVPLFVPFVERCFELAERGGFVGLLVASSFMKRELGRRLVEDMLPAVDLTHIIDASGAYIPGHGTPMAMLIGRSGPPQGKVVRTVIAKRGEPVVPIDPGEGRVWSSIVAHVDRAGYEDDYIAVSDVGREQLATHPWLLGGQDVRLLQEALEQDAVRLGDLVDVVRRGAGSGLDQVYQLPGRTAMRLGLEPEVIWPLIRGANIRDYTCSTDEIAIVPLAGEIQPLTDSHPRWWMWLWRFRTLLINRKSFADVHTVPWWAWRQAPRTPEARTCIVGPAVAGGSHFALVRDGMVPAASALVIEPRDSTSEDELYAWLAFLNSSTACYWMKQVASSMGGLSPQKMIYDFSGTVRRIPIPRAILDPGKRRDELVALARQIERTAQELAATAPDRVLDRWDRSSRGALAESLADAELRERTLLRRMVREQEDLDWFVYEAIGLTKGQCSSPNTSASPNQRPFLWLTDTPPVGLDRRLAESWRRRRKAGQEHDSLKVLESAPYKRAFRSIEDERDGDLEEQRDELDFDDQSRRPLGRRDNPDYRQRTELACEAWLLDHLEKAFRDLPPRSMAIQEISLSFGAIPGVTTVVAVLAGERGELSGLAFERHVAKLLSAHAVPYLAALRHTESGLEKRAQWETVWTLQRRQDAGQSVGSIPVPPHYGQADYRDASTFLHRGKLDVPAERFIAYPAEDDAEPRYGWAGWTPAQQAEVLAALVEQRQDVGNPAQHLTPILAGMLELVPWMPSWHGDVPVDGSAAQTFQLRVQDFARRLQLESEALRAWRPSGQLR